MQLFILKYLGIIVLLTLWTQGSTSTLIPPSYCHRELQIIKIVCLSVCLFHITDRPQLVSIVGLLLRIWYPANCVISGPYNLL